MKKKRAGKDKYLLLVELTGDARDKLAELARKRDWSMRKTIKHAVEEMIARETT